MTESFTIFDAYSTQISLIVIRIGRIVLTKFNYPRSPIQLGQLKGGSSKLNNGLLTLFFAVSALTPVRLRRKAKSSLLLFLAAMWRRLLPLSSSTAISYFFIERRISTSKKRLFYTAKISSFFSLGVYSLFLADFFNCFSICLMIGGFSNAWNTPYAYIFFTVFDLLIPFVSFFLEQAS